MTVLAIIRVDPGPRQDILFDASRRIDAVKLADLILKEVRSRENAADWRISIERILELARMSSV